MIWGTGFVAQRLVVDHVAPLTFNAARLTLGGLVLLPLAWKQGRAIARGSSTRQAWTAGFALAIVMMAGSFAQQIGLETTTAGKAGFITGLYVVLVPFVGVFMRQRTALSSWIGAIIATVGLYFLSVTEALTIAKGDLWVLLSTAFWAAQILLITWILQHAGAFWVACVQSLGAGILSWVAAFWIENPASTPWGSILGPTVYSAVMSVAIAFSLQALGQRHAPSSHAAILLSLEAVFAAFAGWLYLHEGMTPRGVFGAALMLAGMLISQLAPQQRSGSEPCGDPPQRAA
jgi:drug/metabolite transporter (DMT)-like permease